MRNAALGISMVFALLVGCDSGDNKTPTKPRAAKAAPEVDAGTSPEATALGEPVVKVVRPDDEVAAPKSGHGASAEDVDDLVEASPGHAYGQILIQARSEDNHIAELTIVRAEGVRARSGPVRYTAEPRVVVASAKATIDESNLLGTGIAVDIDGDAKTTSKIKTKCDSGTVVLETQPPIRLDAVTALSDAVARFDYGENDSRVLSSKTAGAVLYAPCDSGKIVLGLDPAAPLKMREIPSPAVFVVYRVEVESADAQDPFSLQKVAAGEEALEHELYPFREFSVEGDKVRVYAAHLVVFALDPGSPLQHVSLEIAGAQPEFVTASINEVDADGQRVRYADGFKPF